MDKKGFCLMTRSAEKNVSNKEITERNNTILNIKNKKARIINFVTHTYIFIQLKLNVLALI